MIAPENTPQTRAPLHQRRGVRQFIKFGIVGATSTIINFTIFNVLYHLLNVSLVPSLTVAFFVSVLNGFFWNRHWTFKEARSKPAHTQSLQFLAVNIIGWLLNTSIVVLIVAHHRSDGHGLFGSAGQLQQIVFAILTGQGKQHYSFWLLNGALAIATAVVVFWNFFANKKWTFKQ